MFFLKDLPDRRTLEDFQERYPKMELSAVNCCLHLLRTGNDMMAALERMFSGYDLSQGRFIVMVLLHRTPGCYVNPSDLATKAGVRRPTITGLLERLMVDELIERKNMENDRRRQGVRLTTKGVDLLEKILPEYYATITTMLAGTENAQRESTILLTRKIMSNLDLINKERLS